MVVIDTTTKTTAYSDPWTLTHIEGRFEMNWPATETDGCLFKPMLQCFHSFSLVAARMTSLTAFASLMAMFPIRELCFSKTNLLEIIWLTNEINRSATCCKGATHLPRSCLNCTGTEKKRKFYGISKNEPKLRNFQDCIYQVTRRLKCWKICFIYMTPAMSSRKSMLYMHLDLLFDRVK